MLRALGTEGAATGGVFQSSLSAVSTDLLTDAFYRQEGGGLRHQKMKGCSLYSPGSHRWLVEEEYMHKADYVLYPRKMKAMTQAAGAF